MRLSIIIPAYNEQRRIRPTLEEYVERFRNWDEGDFEVVVVLNGCRDDTRGVVEAFAAVAPEVRIAEFAAPLGKGGALREGLALAQGSLLLFVDADNMVRAPEAAKLVDALNEHDLAIGDRFNGDVETGEAGSGDESKSRLRRFVSMASRLWVRRFLGLAYSDTQCGAKALRAEAWRTVAPHLRENGWAFDLDLLSVAQRLGCDIAGVPVRWRHIEEGSKVQPWRDAPATFFATFRIRQRVRRLP